jgi:hypothetical protein
VLDWWPYSMADCTRWAYCGFSDACRINDGLVVASVGLYWAMAINGSN